MKTWQTIAILALSVVIALLGWTLSPSDRGAKKAPEGMRVAHKKVGKPSAEAVRVAKFASNRGRHSDDFKLEMSDEKSINLSFGDDFGFEDEISEKLSSVIQAIYDQYLAASKKDDRKAMLAAIQRLLAKAAAGEDLPVWLKEKMLEGVKWVGGEAMPEVLAMAADADESISTMALEALQELLWDFDTTPQQIADALTQVVRLSTDASVIEPFVFEMNDMPVKLRVDAALAVFDSGNQVAVKCLTDNMDFIFDDFSGSMKTRDDVVRYAKERVSDETVTTVTGN